MEEAAGRELRIGRCARRAFERLSDRRMERLFRMVQNSQATESLLNAPDFSFDWHSRLILRAAVALRAEGGRLAGLAATRLTPVAQAGIDQLAPAADFAPIVCPKTWILVSPVGACRGAKPLCVLLFPPRMGDEGG